MDTLLPIVYFLFIFFIFFFFFGGGWGVFNVKFKLIFIVLSAISNNPFYTCPPRNPINRPKVCTDTLFPIQTLMYMQYC